MLCPTSKIRVVVSCSLDDEGDDGDNEAVGEFERPSAERPGGCPLVITGTKAIKTKHPSLLLTIINHYQPLLTTINHH